MKQQTERRKRALTRLEAQLKSGVKKQKKSNLTESLSEKDTKRIQKEIAVLKERI